MPVNSDLMFWFENCGHDITIMQSNKSKDYVVIAIDNITNDVFKSSGKDLNNTLLEIKLMLNGKYKS